jgi:DNA-binding NarL/FixJ family response regulator
MPKRDVIEATRRNLRSHPAVRVLMLTAFGLDSYVYESH